MSGMYFLRHFEGGKKFFAEWFMQKSTGHDQDGFNTMSRWAALPPHPSCLVCSCTSKNGLCPLRREHPMLCRNTSLTSSRVSHWSRGREFRGDMALPSSSENMRNGERMFACALDNNTLVSFLPVSMFGNAYT